MKYKSSQCKGGPAAGTKKRGSCLSYSFSNLSGADRRYRLPQLQARVSSSRLPHSHTHPILRAGTPAMSA